ncbi:MAG TPA: hypothetical protein VFA26_24690 [Gemmataceae bacterium]|nr:hypothetical protein [Gemmataceae bacterium]
MGQELICSWLGLESSEWPPDHYRLLGLPPGEPDVRRIEEQVHARLEGVRRYQLTHPQQVTEAMNRLAQAFICLTDPEAKRAYDAQLFGPSQVIEAVAVESPPEPTWPEAPPILSQAQIPTQLDVPPPPPDRPLAMAALPVAEVLPPAAPPAAPAGPPPANVPAAPPAPAPPPPLPDPLAEEARSPRARRGLGTKEALYHRVVRTRRLLEAWEKAGKYLGNPQRRLNKPAEASELIRQLKRIRNLLEDFPPLLGEAGQPGYLVVALARQPTPVPTFQTLLDSQRETLAQHWQAGHKLLVAHRQFLRQELRGLRRKGPFRLALRAARAFVNDNPGSVLLVLGALAVLILFMRLLER